MSRFPVAFRPPAFASRSSDSRQGVGPSSRSAYRFREAGPRRGYRVPHARAATGVGAPYTPRTMVLTRPGRLPTGTRRFPAAVPKPRNNIPPCEALVHEASTGVHSRSPVRSSPRPRLRDGTGSASVSPRASHPAVTGSARQGQGQAIEHGPGTTLTTSAEPPILRVHSMRATSRRTANRGCVAMRISRPASMRRRVSGAAVRIAPGSAKLQRTGLTRRTVPSRTLDPFKHGCVHWRIVD
jgi:hypothetical protein